MLCLVLGRRSSLVAASAAESAMAVVRVKAWLREYTAGSGVASTVQLVATSIPSRSGASASVRLSRVVQRWSHIVEVTSGGALTFTLQVLNDHSSIEVVVNLTGLHGIRQWTEDVTNVSQRTASGHKVDYADVLETHIVVTSLLTHFVASNDRCAFLISSIK